jgi:hypothetical protein
VSKADRLLRLATWLIPALFFLVSGAAKLIDPSGIAPRGLSHLPYPLLLRLLGLLEFGLGVLLLVPRTRNAGRFAAVVLLAGFSLLVALSADDGLFLRNCGCFGGLPLSGPGSYAFLAARNALLCGLVCLGFFVGAPGAWPRAGLVVLLVLLSTLYLGERTLRRSGHQTARRLAALLGGPRGGRPRMPDLPLLRADGEVSTTRETLRASDHIIFFSPSCAACKRLAPGWAEFGRRLSRRGQRLLLFSVSDPAGVPEFKSRYGCSDLDHVVARNGLDVARLGIPTIPRLLVLDEDRRIRFHEVLAAAPSFARALAACGTRVDGLERSVWDRMAAALFGDGASCGAFSEPAPGIRRAPVRDSGGDSALLAVLEHPARPAHRLELAVGLRGDRIEGVLPLSTGGYAEIVDPGLNLLDGLTGLTLAQSLQLADREDNRTGPEAPIWRGVHALLARLREALPGP